MNRKGRPGDRWMIAGLCAWFLVVAAAMGGLWRYKTTAGEPSRAPSMFPSASRLAREHDRPLLLMFAHPQCTCTRASFAELRVLMNEFQGRVTAHVVFLAGGGDTGSWSASDSRGLARSIEGVRVEEDRDGTEASMFGAATSGSVLLYGRDGRLLFHGGITGARGHVGDNPGRDELTHLLRGDTTAAAPTPVFGCSLRDPT